MNPRAEAWKNWLTMSAHVNDAIGGDIEEARSGILIRGRIKAIRLDGHKLVITTEWAAIYEDEGKRWRIYRSKGADVFTCDLRDHSDDLPVEDEKTGIITFNTTLVDYTIYPKRSRKTLDASKVQGL